MSDFNPTRDEMMSALFAHMVIQQTNMAMMMLGKVPHPQTGETITINARRILTFKPSQVLKNAINAEVK